MDIFKRFLRFNRNPTTPGIASSFHTRSLIWVAAAIGSIGLKELLPARIWEHLFYRGWFTVLRNSYDYLLGWLPVPMVYMVFGIILFRSISWARQWKKGQLYQWSRLVGGIGAMVTIFYWGWGFNYGQIPLQERLHLRVTGIEEEAITREFVRATKALEEAASRLTPELLTDTAVSGYPVKDDQVRREVEYALSILGLPHAGRVRVRHLWPDGLLLRLNTAGIYIPHAFEGHIDAGLLSVQQPFTMAHEMAHGYGIADEGACNFIAWLACVHSRDPWLHFGGAFTYWRYVAAEMPPDTIKNVLQALPEVVRRSMRLIRENDDKYPEIMPAVRDAIYATYLKKHGVSHGLRSYNEVVLMVQQYLEKQESKPEVPD